MKAPIQGLLISLALSCAALTPAEVFATNGYSPHGFGNKSKSMGGAGVALPLDGMSAGTNPALMVGVGARLDVGADLFSPSDRGYTANDDGSPVGPADGGPPTIVPGTIKSDNDLFLIPHFAYNRMLDEQSSIGIAIGGNGGMNTEYDTAVFAPFNNPGTPDALASSPTGVDLVQLFIGVPYARKLSPQHAVGIEPVIAVQSFEATGLEPFKNFSESRDKVTNNGHDESIGGGLRIGWFGQITDLFSLGAAYQTRLNMSRFKDYEGLFAEQGDFDIPATLILGAAFKATPTLTIAFDVQEIFYSDVDALGNTHDINLLDPNTPRLGADDGLGFGWKDQTIYKLGAQWEYRPDLVFRAGYSHADQVIPGAQALFNILAPAVIQDHFTLGVGKHLANDSEINFAFMYAPKETVSGTNPNTGPQTGDIFMEQLEFGVSWGKRF